MDKIIDKFPAYDIFNYCIPGVLFCAIFSYLLNIDYPKDNQLFYAIILICAAVFAGQAISRVGSIIIEPLSRKTKLLKWSSNYYKAEKKDPELKTLLRNMNNYRTYVSLVLFLVPITLYSDINQIRNGFDYIFVLIVEILLILVFYIAYVKEAKAIFNRIKSLEK